jgi:DNA-binding NarL/FixJ family response regulator
MDVVRKLQPATGQEVRVVVISAVQIYSHGVARLLGGEQGITVAGTVRDAETAVKLFDSSHVDVFLLDVTGERGLEALHELAAMATLPVVVLGIMDRPGEVVAYVEAGIAGYVTDEHTADDLFAAVRAAHRGEFSCPATVAAGLATRLALLAREQRRSSLSHLTSRELEILELIESGSSNKEIARQLHIQLATVKNHVHNVLRKLGVRGRAEAAAVRRAATLFDWSTCHSRPWNHRRSGHPEPSLCPQSIVGCLPSVHGAVVRGELS